MKIVILGAGSIGCYVGGRLVLGAVDVHLIGRQRLGHQITAHGLYVTHADQVCGSIAGDKIAYHLDYDILAVADVIIVSVKSQDTASVMDTLKTYAPKSATIISLQNGVGNVAMLRAGLPRHAVFAAMVPYNVVNLSSNTGRDKGVHFHQATDGDLYVDAAVPRIDAVLAAFTQAGLPIRAHDNMQSVLWGKLLMNLNNAVNALSGLPLKTQLEDRYFRKALAATQTECLRILNAVGIVPAQVSKIAPRFFPRILRLPTIMFKRVAARSLKIDETARSSMADDLALGRTCEIDFINGALVDLARANGLNAPVNTLMTELTKTLFKSPSPAIHLTGKQLWAQIKAVK